MAKTESVSEEAPEVAFGAARRFVRRLAWLYGGLALALTVFLILRGFRIPGLAPLRIAANEAADSGMAALVLSTLLMAFMAILATLAMASVRGRVSALGRVISVGFRKRRVNFSLPEFTPGFVARVGQSVILTAGAIAAGVAVWILAPKLGLIPQIRTENANVLAAIAFGLACPALVTERAMAALTATQLPEAPSLRRLLLLATVLFVIAGTLGILRGAGFAWAIWPIWILTWVPLLIAVELAVRALARLFLPAPTAAAAKASTDSMLADVATRGPRAPAQLIKSHLGLDFSRSWALSYLSAAFVPAVALTALFCWLLTGVKLINTGERGVYESFGAPQGVLSPGLHVVMPWPFGQVHSVEFGTIHSVAAGTDATGDPDQGLAAEDIPPVSLDRLWTTQHATQAQFLVASDSAGKQTFQTVNTEILVLYRIGLTDADAMAAVYGVNNPETVVRQSASRLAVRYFGSRTLDMVMGAQRESLQETLRAEIARDVASAKGGIEIVAVVIEEIHPPAGAAAAYHAVQAAEINAKASVSAEIGRAEATAGTAQSEAITLVNGAQATAVETVQAASGEAYRFAADKRGYDLGPRSFLMERSFANLAAALPRAPLTLIDHRIKIPGGSIIDMRSSQVIPTPGSDAADPGTTPSEDKEQP